ncbi:MAG: PAS domain S-box protein [Bacteroidetes bacterium]|nr:PAS domain S-box protein [Bacteroidota bacterium]
MNKKEDRSYLNDFMEMTSRLARMGSWKLEIHNRKLTLSDITCQVINAPVNFIPEIESLTSLITVDDKSKFINALHESELRCVPFDLVMHMNSLTGNRLVVRIIGVPVMTDGKCSEISGFIQDITEKTKAEEEVTRRENMLRAIASASEELLSNPNYMEAVAKSLPVLGKAVNVDRVYFFKIAIDRDKKITASQIFEWNSGFYGPQIDNPELQNLYLDQMEGFLDDIYGKRSFSSITSNLLSGSPLRLLLESQDIRSELVIPVFLDDSLWGYVGYDECKYDRIWTDGEISILKSFCSSISIAIERSDYHQMLEKLSKVARSNRLGVHFTDPDMKIIYANESLLNLTGYSLDEVLGKMPYELFQGPLTQLESAELLNTSYKKEGAIDVDIILYRKDKTWFWANVKKQFLDSSLERSDFFSIIEDISEKKFAVENLRASQMRLSSLIMNLKEGILLEDESRKIVFINRHFCNMFKINADPADLEGSDCALAMKNASQSFLRPEYFIDRTNQIISGNKLVLEEELELVNQHVLERDYIPIIIDNKTKGHLWKYKDVTANRNQVMVLKQQEEKYRNIIANIKMGLVETDINDVIMSVNQQLCDMTGYSEAELIGKEYVDLLVEKDFREQVREKRKLRREGVSDIYQTQIRLKNGNKGWWLTSGGPNFNDSGVIIGTVGISIDLTDQKTLELELGIALKKAEESSKAKEAFLANMSHEMRTPLNVIIGMIREISRESLSPKQNQYIRNAVMASNHLLSIVSNVLDIAKIESGLMKLDLHPFSLIDVINDTLTVLTPMAREKLLVIRTDISGMLSPAYIGDSIRLRQILINIINNAIKFTDKGFISIGCNVVGVKDNIHSLSLTISDTGIGMNESYLRNIFQKFSQSDPSSARKYGGTGLGMAITRELIQMMNGAIYIKSKIGEGTEVKIEIELHTANIKELEETPVPENFDSLKNKRILLVEDNDMNRLVARNSLSLYGINITESENGLSAIEILKKMSFDLILMDLQMPFMGGIEATGIIRGELGLSTPIIALTANSIKEELDRCIKAGMDDYLIKPFEENVLLSKIYRNIKHGNPISETGKTIVMSDKIFSLDLIMELSRGNMDFVRKMVSVFCEQTPETVENINSTFKINDLATVRMVSHRIKPNLTNFGIVSASEDIKVIESLSANGTSTHDLEDKIKSLETIVNNAVRQLKNEKI